MNIITYSRNELEELIIKSWQQVELKMYKHKVYPMKLLLDIQSREFESASSTRGVKWPWKRIWVRDKKRKDNITLELSCFVVWHELFVSFYDFVGVLSPVLQVV